MFKKNQPDTSKIDAVIDDTLTAMSPYDENFLTMIDGVERLTAIKDGQTSKNRVSPDTLAIVAGNLIGIVIIVGHERANVITSQAVKFLGKLR